MGEWENERMGYWGNAIIKIKDMTKKEMFIEKMKQPPIKSVTQILTNEIEELN